MRFHWHRYFNSFRFSNWLNDASDATNGDVKQRKSRLTLWCLQNFNTRIKELHRDWDYYQKELLFTKNSGEKNIVKFKTRTWGGLFRQGEGYQADCKRQGYFQTSRWVFTFFFHNYLCLNVQFSTFCHLCQFNVTYNFNMYVEYILWK